MRIAFVCNEYPPLPHGGIGTFVHTIAHSLRSIGHEITVVGYGKLVGERDDYGIRVVILPETRTRGIAWIVNRRRLHNWLTNEAGRGNIDIIETPECGGALPFAFSVCPVVVRLHSSKTVIARNDGGYPFPTMWLCERQTLRGNSNWISVSNFIYTRTVRDFRCAPRISRTIYNPAPIIPPISDSTIAGLRSKYGKYVLFASTISEQKGALVLAIAANEFLSVCPDVKLLYVGAPRMIDGKPPQRAIYEVVEPSLHERILFLGRKEHPEVLTMMKAARVVALPSRHEAFAMVPLEAMACGVPMVYTNLASGPEVIRDGIDGLLADPNSADDVATKIIRILQDDEFGQRLVFNASRSVVRFSVEQCMKDTLSFYSQCLEMR